MVRCELESVGALDWTDGLVPESTSAMTTAAVILAAGGGTRFGATADGHKLLTPFRGRPLVSWAIDHALDAGLDETIVVMGAVDFAEVVPDGVTLARNNEWSRGLATSLALAIGLAGSPGHGHDAIVVGLGDQPLIPPEAWIAVAAATAKPIAVASFDGHLRNPVRLARLIWSLLPIEGDEGAKPLIRSRPDLVEAIPCAGSAADIDTREDIDRWS